MFVHFVFSATRGGNDITCGAAPTLFECLEHFQFLTETYVSLNTLSFVQYTMCVSNAMDQTKHSKHSAFKLFAFKRLQFQTVKLNGCDLGGMNNLHLVYVKSTRTNEFIVILQNIVLFDSLNPYRCIS